MCNYQNVISYIYICTYLVYEYYGTVIEGKKDLVIYSNISLHFLLFNCQNSLYYSMLATVVEFGKTKQIYSERIFNNRIHIFKLKYLLN